MEREEFEAWLDQVAKLRGVHRSKLLRLALQEWVEDHKHELPPDLTERFRELKDWDGDGKDIL